MLTWHFITRDAYELMNDSLKTSDKLFFIKDDKSILNGTDVFNEDIILYNNYPTTIISNKVYININTLEGMVYTSTSWSSIIDPVIITRSDYLNSSDIKSITYDEQYNHLVVTKIDSTEDTIELSDLSLDVNYSAGVFTIVNEDCHLSYGRKIILNDFIDDITYDGNGNLTITFKDSDSLLSISTGNILDRDGDIDFTITGNSFIAECVVYANNTNEMTVANDIYTIYRDSTSISTEVAADTIATITDYMATIVDSSLSLMTTVGFNKTNEILLADDEGNAKASGVKITETISKDNPTNRFIPTEKGIVDYMNDKVLIKNNITTHEEFQKLKPETASDKKMVSEKALFEQISWGIV